MAAVSENASQRQIERANFKSLVKKLVSGSIVISMVGITVYVILLAIMYLL